jgi:Tubulin-tyrosine ligase family
LHDTHYCNPYIRVMLIGVVIIICFLLILGLMALLSLAATIPLKRGSAESPANTKPWRGTVSVCCSSAYAPVSVFQRILGWDAVDYDRPSNLVWWITPVVDWYREQTYTKQQGRQLASLKNQLDTELMKPFVNKDRVFTTMISKDPSYAQYLPKSWLIEDFRALMDRSDAVPWPVVMKDPEASIQMGVWVVNNLEDFEELIRTTPTLQKNPKVTINQYISPPLLWYDRPSSATAPEPEDAGQGKKFHLRVFAIFLVRAGVVQFWVPDFAKIMTSKLPYVDADYANKDIHLSGGSRTCREFWWQRDCAWHLRRTPEELAEVWASAVKCMLALAHSAADHLRPYPEGPSGYQLLGADILPDSSLKCWFIEINRRPSWLSVNHDNRSVAITTMHCRYQISNLILPFFGLGFSLRPPDAAYPITPAGPLTPHTAALVAGAGARETVSGWEFRGDMAAAKVLKQLALEARKLPQTSRKNSIVLHDKLPPNTPPACLTWKDVPNIVALRHKLLPPAKRTCWVLTPDAPDAATTRETLDVWIRENLRMTIVSGEPRQEVSLAYAEPGSMNGGLGKVFGRVRATLKSALGDRDAICDKTQLAATLRKVNGSAFTPATWPVDGCPKFVPGDVYIVKQRASSGQEGVYVAGSPEEYSRALGLCRKTGGVVQEYLRWPLTARGRKMHIRAYMAVYIVGGIARAYYASDVHKMMTARLPYVAGDWENRDIHISGGDFTDEWLDWPRDADCSPLEACSAQESIDAAMAALGRAACTTMTKYPDCVGGFHVFGADIIIDARAIHDKDYAAVTPPEQRMRAIILEVNDRPGLGMKELDPKAYEQLSLRYLSWLEHSVVGNHFCTGYSTQAVACEPARGSERYLVEGAPAPGQLSVDQLLLPFVDLLRGKSNVNVQPSGWAKDPSNKYELRTADEVLGYLAPRGSDEYEFQRPAAVWWTNAASAEDTRIRECGLALIRLSESTLTYIPRYTLSAESVPERRGAYDPEHHREKKRTYFRSDAYLTNEFLAWLAPRKLWSALSRAPAPGQHLDWLAGMVQIKTHPSSPATLKVKLDSVELTDKVRLHGYASEFPGVLAETFEVREGSVLPAEGVPWIVRANWAWAGAGNTVVDTNDGLQEARERFSVKPDMLKNRSPARVIASRYIENPMLLGTGHKFHARIHVFLQMGPKLTTRAVILPTVYLMSSEHPYTANDWSNHEIHDTHGRYRDNFRALLEVLLGAKRLREAAFAALSKVFRAMVPRITIYPDTENAYEFFGADVMFTSDGEPIILEVNDNPGIKATPEIETAIQSEMLREIASCVLECFEGVPAGTRPIPPGVLPRDDISAAVPIELDL